MFLGFQEIKQGVKQLNRAIAVFVAIGPSLGVGVFRESVFLVTANRVVAVYCRPLCIVQVQMQIAEVKNAHA